MQIIATKTHKIKPREKIFSILDNYLPRLQEGDIVAIASKIISICENYLVEKNKSKTTLIHQEADICFPSNKTGFFLTLKNQRLIPNAGVDESNCKNFYVCLPPKPQMIAKKIWQHLRKHHKIKKLGIIIADSNVTPLRSGVSGIAIGWCGFKPIHSYVGQKDIFGRTMKVTKINLLDSLATTATLVMGEGKEQKPLAIIKKASKIIFQNRAPTPKEERSTYVNKHDDLFSSIMKIKKYE